MISLSARLALARLTHNRSGLDLLSVIACAVTSFLALTIAGGTWMFAQRITHAPDRFSQMLVEEMPFLPVVETMKPYLWLALLACALLIVPILTLGGAAARLGASGRSRRLASLRLMGMTGSQVVIMSIIETLVLTTIGTIVGLAAWLASTPAWSSISFHLQPISASEMLMPWWLITAVVAAILALSALSTVTGLRRVRISPLGVAHKHTAPMLTPLRLVFLLVAAIAVILSANQSQAFVNSNLGSIMVALAVVASTFIAFNLAGPVIIQIIARLGGRTSNPSRLVAMKRLVADPRSAWRNVSSVTLMTMIAVAMTLASTSEFFHERGAITPGSVIASDILTGVTITLVIGFLLSATSTLINQASLAVDRSDQTVALDRMGTPRALFTTTRLRQVSLPLLSCYLIAVPLGFALGFMFVYGSSDYDLTDPSMLARIGIILASGLLLTIGAALACHPIESKIIGQTYRPND